MKRLPTKKYQRLCAQYNRAMQRAIRLEILLDDMVRAQLTADEFDRRSVDFANATQMRTFLVPMEAELRLWREEADQ